MLDYGMLTCYGENLDPSVVLQEYPRPQLRRESYLNLNGKWRFSVSKKGDISAVDGQITVPFPPESILSGVNGTPDKGEYLVYSRDFTVPEGFLKQTTLLHIGAADQICEAFINGKPAGAHEGGYLPADFDISEYIKPGENTVAVRVKDDMSYLLPTGKQRKKRGGIWYTPVSGIWQTVWLESVPEGYIRGLKLTPDVSSSSVTVDIDSDSSDFTYTVTSSEGKIADCVRCGRRFSFIVPQAMLRLWSPESPYLYDITVSSGTDTVKSYFAMRSFSVSGNRFLLNGKPYFVNGVLDQGYFSDGIYTPASYEAYRDDILSMKKLGFNSLRKHIKLEPMMFYFYCDTLGMLVLQDMVNVGKYSFFKDTLLPFAGCRKRPYVNVGKAAQRTFTEHCLSIQNYLYNCPCVVYYTVFNEGWGQFDGDGMYSLMRSADPTRVYDATSGWYHEHESDVVSEHVYFKAVKPEKSDRPIIISEFGGYSYNCPGHVFNKGKSFGYRKYGDEASLFSGVYDLYANEILPNIRNGIAGAIYTQLSDVEDETNGIMTYDRRVCKLDAEKLLPIMKRVCVEGGREELLS